MDKEQRQHLKIILQVHRDNLHHLEVQSAKYGTLNVPTHLFNEIANEQAAISSIEQQLKESDDSITVTLNTTRMRYITIAIFLTLLSLIGIYITQNNPFSLPSQKPTVTTNPVIFPSGTVDIARSTFDEGDDGWSVSGDAEEPSYVVDGINGYIKSTDNASTDADWYWSAPPSFLGNKSAAYRGKLTFRLIDLSNNNLTPYRKDDDIILEGDGIRLRYSNQWC